MASISFHGMNTEDVTALREGKPDSYGNTPERTISDGHANPCRHCMQMIEAGADMLIVAHRPFSAHHAYAETGPILLHADECPTYQDDGTLPPIFDSPSYMIRGYCADERIIYGTGTVVGRGLVQTAAEEILSDRNVAFVHIRSASNNCWQGRIERK